MKRIFFLLTALLFFGCPGAFAQSALDQLNQIAGYANMNVPPPSEPVCAVCRIPMRGARPWDHKSWCEFYRPAPGTQVQTQSGSRVEDPYADERGNYTRVTYPQQQVEVYMPPTPIRDTPEGQAILQITEQLGYAAGNLMIEGLRDLFSWGFDRIYESTHREYHSADPEKGWGNLQVVKENGKEGVWDNVSHKWLVKPGKFDEFLILDPYNCAARKNGKWGLIEATDKGRELVPCQFDEVLFYTCYGTGSPVGLGVMDQGGNMHWIIGRTVLEDGKYVFIPYEGEWSSLDFSFKPIPGEDDNMVAIVAKDAKTGKSKVLNYSTKPIFGRSYEQYDNVFLTGMVETERVGNVNTWYDFYRVENNGKTGFVVTQNSADYKANYMSYEMLECEYDEITPMANTIGWKEAKRWGSDDYKGKELVIAEKNGRFGVGRPSRIKYKDELPYRNIMVMKVPFGDTKLPVIIGVKPDGEYEALHPDGMGVWLDKPMGYNEEGKLVLLHTSVHGYVLNEVMEDVQESLRTNPKDWNLTEDEISSIVL